jgi:hypothetical protein
VYTVSGKPLLLTLTSKSVADTSPLIVTYRGSVKDLEMTRQGDVHAGRGPITVTVDLELVAEGAECSGSTSRTYEVGVTAAPVADAPDQLDLRFDYPAGGLDTFTITCKSKEGTGAMPAPWSGLISLLPLPGEAHRVGVDSPTRISLPPAPYAISIDLTVRKAK